MSVHTPATGLLTVTELAQAAEYAGSFGSIVTVTVPSLVGVVLTGKSLTFAEIMFESVAVLNVPPAVVVRLVFVELGRTFPVESVRVTLFRVISCPTSGLAGMLSKVSCLHNPSISKSREQSGFVLPITCTWITPFPGFLALKYTVVFGSTVIDSKRELNNDCLVSINVPAVLISMF